MLTAQDIAKKLDLPIERVGFMYAKRILPDGVKVGGIIRFRENDVKKFYRYLLKRHECRKRGIDPDSMRGPAPPVYSTGGKPRFDPRLVMANEKEGERHRRSRTLAAGSKPIGPQPQVEMPQLSAKPSRVEN